MLLVSHLWSIAKPYPVNMLLYKLGSWMPGWWGIGPYAGKETVGLVGWLASWIVCHLLLRNRSIALRPMFYWFLIGCLLLMIGFWPPVYHAVFGWLPALP